VTVLDESPRTGDHGGRAIYEQNRWSALRYGPRAELVHPIEDRMAPALELGAELLERIEPVARRLGTADLLAPLAERTCEADRQLEVGRSDGLVAAAADLVERSLPSG
jgi:gamma-glutamyl:cysteine ligase YbdK (ATP-grasp superfamily)